MTRPYRLINRVPREVHSQTAKKVWEKPGYRQKMSAISSARMKKRWDEKRPQMLEMVYKHPPIPKPSKWVTITEQEVRVLFEQYRDSGVSVSRFSRSIKTDCYRLSLAFRKYFAEEYSQIIESKIRSGRGYTSGRHFELRVQKLYQTRGYYVVLSAKSEGIADLVCVKRGEVLFVQCKVDPVSLTAIERTDLIDGALECGAIPVLAYRGLAPNYEINLKNLYPI